MLENKSPMAPDAPWPRYKEDEEVKDKCSAAVKDLSNLLKSKNASVLEVREFSNQNVSLIFNHLLKVCINHRKDKDQNTETLF